MSVIGWPLKGTGLGVIVTSTRPTAELGGGAGAGVGAGAGAGDGTGFGAGAGDAGAGAAAGPRAVPDGTAALRAGMSVGAVGADSISPQAVAAASAAAAQAARTRMLMVGSISSRLRKTHTGIRPTWT